MSLARWSPVLVAGFWIVLAGRENEPSEAVTQQPAQPAPTGPFQGSGSCSATACHGSISQLGPSISKVRRNEHTTWITADPHSHAYQTLLDEHSQRIVSNLAADPAKAKAAHEDERCLACHTTPRPTSALVATSWMNPDGVGCESCHGASGRWLGPHTTIGWPFPVPPELQRTDLAGLTVRERNRKAKEGRGLSDTKTLARCAAICTGCHVGSRCDDGLPTRDVNHDLIAAGHPRLNFELAAYLDKMPPHWDEKEENADPAHPSRRAKDFPARAWAIGQLATELASLVLLNRRAADSRTPWPEFTEYRCFSCHFELRDEAWRRKPRTDGASLGTPHWGSLSMPVIERLVGNPVTQPFTESLCLLSCEMAQPVPDKDAVKRESRETSKALGQCLEALAAKRFEAGEVRSLIDLLSGPEVWDRSPSWEEVVRIYLALVVLRKAWIELEPARKVDQEKLETRLEELRRQLDFPSGFDSPHGFNPDRLRRQLEW